MVVVMLTYLKILDKVDILLVHKKLRYDCCSAGIFKKSRYG